MHSRLSKIFLAATLLGAPAAHSVNNSFTTAMTTINEAFADKNLTTATAINRTVDATLQLAEDVTHLGDMIRTNPPPWAAAGGALSALVVTAPWMAYKLRHIQRNLLQGGLVRTKREAHEVGQCIATLGVGLSMAGAAYLAYKRAEYLGDTGAQQSAFRLATNLVVAPLGILAFYDCAQMIPLLRVPRSHHPVVHDGVPHVPDEDDIAPPPAAVPHHAHP